MLVAIVATGAARAQGPAEVGGEVPVAPAPPALVPPRALDAGEVPYPKGAQGEATVILEIVVAADGRASEVRVVEGAEPFASAAREAASAWRFDPARRGDTSVPARVKMRVTFTPGASEPPSDVRAQPSPAPAAKREAREDSADEVRVQGARRETGTTSFGRSEVRQIPGAFGDPFRAIEALPGVTPIVSGLPFFFVRGAPPGNTGYFIDGVRVPLLYHLGLGPSVIHPGLIERVDFYPGGFPARYGRFTGGVLAGETRPPATRFHGEANARVFDAGALVESPFADGRGTALAGGRYSYTSAILSLVAPKTSLSYWDYQARATWKLGERDRIGVFAFGSYDYLGERNERSGAVRDLFTTQFHRVDLRYDHAIGRDGNVRLAASLGADTTGDDRSDVHDTLTSVRMELENKLTSDVRLRAGTDVAYDHYSLIIPTGAAQTSTRLLYPPRDDVVTGAYGDLVWRPSPRVEIVPGLRAEIYDSHRLDHPPIRVAIFNDRGGFTRMRTFTDSALVALDPRLTTRVSVARRVAWLSTFGVSHQKPSFFLPLPGLQIGELQPSLQVSYQASQGLEISLPAEITAVTTAFVHDYVGLTDLTVTCNTGDTTNDVRNICVSERVRGRTIGAELLVRRALTKRLTGWIAYTLSRSTRETRAFRSSEIINIPSEYDRTHVLNAVGAYDLGAGWRAGARFFFYTGRPYSQTAQGLPIAPYNSLRLPAFYRIDVRLEKRWRVSENASIALVAEGLNVTLQKEAIDVTCTETTGLIDRCQPDYIGPVTIPSLGVEAFF